MMPSSARCTGCAKLRASRRSRFLGQRDVMEQILFEIGVVARTKARPAPGQFGPGIVGREGRLDMDEIGSVLAKQWQEFAP